MEVEAGLWEILQGMFDQVRWVGGVLQESNTLLDCNAGKKHVWFIIDVECLLPYME